MFVKKATTVVTAVVTVAAGAAFAAAPASAHNGTWVSPTLSQVQADAKCGEGYEALPKYNSNKLVRYYCSESQENPWLYREAWGWFAPAQDPSWVKERCNRYDADSYPVRIGGVTPHWTCVFEYRGHDRH